MASNNSDSNQIIQRNDDGTFTKETLKRALKALKKRLKVTRLDDESRLGHDAIAHPPPPRPAAHQSQGSIIL